MLEFLDEGAAMVFLFEVPQHAQIKKSEGKSTVEENAGYWYLPPAPLVQGDRSTGCMQAAQGFSGSAGNDAPSH